MAPVNPDPFAHPDFLAALEAAGYLQRLDTSEKRITERYQHALSKMQFAAHSEEFLTRAGVKKVHRSTVQFFNEDPVADPFVHVQVGTLPPSKQGFAEPRGCTESIWTPIRSSQEAEGTRHFTVSFEGFWPVTVVFDINQSQTEDKYSGIRYDDESDSDPEQYLGPSRSRRTGGMSGTQYASSSYGGMGGAGGTSSSRYGRGSSRRNSYAAGAGDESSSSGSDGEGGLGYGNGRGTGGSFYTRSTGGMGGAASSSRSAGRSSSRRASMSAGDIDAALGQMATSGGGGGGMGRSASRASRASRY
ncbi:hypothetical protein JCM8547_006293 [Rhodosporidiobolus lusitaniae]